MSFTISSPHGTQQQTNSGITAGTATNRKRCRARTQLTNPTPHRTLRIEMIFNTILISQSRYHKAHTLTGSTRSTPPLFHLASTVFERHVPPIILHSVARGLTCLPLCSHGLSSPHGFATSIDLSTLPHGFGRLTTYTGSFHPRKARADMQPIHLRLERFGADIA